MYCQLVKQTTLNPSSESCIRGWELLLSVLATCPPSEQLAPHVGWHFGEHLSSTQESADYTQSVANYAEKCLIALPKVMKLGCRRERPTLLGKLLQLQKARVFRCERIWSMGGTSL